MTTHRTDEKYNQIRQTWERARLAVDRDPSGDASLEEQDSWDALIEFVETNDLTYTVRDPR